MLTQPQKKQISHFLGVAWTCERQAVMYVLLLATKLLFYVIGVHDLHPGVLLVAVDNEVDRLPDATVDATQHVDAIHVSVVDFVV